MQWNELRSQLRHLPVSKQDKIHEAFELGKTMHEGQLRKSGEPYFNHPIAVAHMLADMGADAETISAALLHDTVEDTELRLPEIEQRFGRQVHDLIEGVTKLSTADVAGRPNMDEQIETLRKIFTLMEKDIRIMVIKLVDRLHNMQTIEFLPPQKQQNLARETIDVYVKIADRLCMQDLRDELEGLCLSVLEPDLYQKLSELRTQNEPKGEAILRSMDQRLRAHFSTLALTVKSSFEQKSWQSLREQLQTEGTTVTGVSDHTAVFVCDTVGTCYEVMGALHQMWKREILSFQDFINSPAINGYRGLHTTMILEDGTRVRCKIRTQAMQEYARKGVTVLCFGESPHNLQEALPWTGRISPLSEDTTGRSKQFFETLRSDILGDSILIHGPGDQTVLVPKGSTALDGAFYLFGKEALSLTSISIGGKKATLDAALDHAMSLNVTLGTQESVDRSWLDKSKTGFAAATIRSALVRGKSDSEKMPLGRDLLQRELTIHKRGFLEEFNEKKMSDALKGLGYASFQEMLIAIADGRLEPAVAYRQLFDMPSIIRTANGNGAQKCTVHFQMPKDDPGAMRRLMSLYQTYTVQMKNIRLWSPPGSTQTHFNITISLSPKEQDTFAKELLSAGASNVDVVIHTKRETALIAAVILPWALNPVMAQWLLRHGMQPLPLITIRLLTFALFSIFFFVGWRIWKRQAYTPIRRLPLLAALPALGTAGLSLFTYLALLIMPPSVHLTILRFNTFLPLSLTDFRNWRKTARTFTMFLALISTVILLLLVALGTNYLLGILLSLVTLLFYTFYSVATERTLQQHRIDMRQPYLLLQMGLMLGALGIVLLFFQPLSLLLQDLTWKAILYVLVCVCLPHACYSALLKKTRFRYFTDLLLIEVPITMFLEAIILGTVLSPFTYAAVFLILALLLAWRWEKVTLRL